MDMHQFTLLCVYILAGIIGLCVGSFLNVVIYRLPNEMSLFKPASHCTQCGYELKWYDNIPVLSYIFIKGRCRQCRAPISPRYIAVEILNTLLWLLSVFLFFEQSILYMAIAMIVSSVLICVFFIDLEHMIIFDRFHIILALCGIAAMFCDSLTTWPDHIIGALAGGIVFAALYYGSIAILKQEGIGFGDVKYSAAAGLLLGWQKFIPSMLIASIIGAIFMISANRINHAEKRTEYPFGPFLAFGTIVAMFFGNSIIRWYLELLF